jgi:hypothetical protein
LYASDLNEIINHLYNFYLLAFDNQEQYNIQNENILLAKYKNLLKELNSSSVDIKDSNRFFYDYTINVSEEKHFKFDIAWKNGSLNLVKPVSFDLVRPETILNKAYRFFGQFTDLESLAKINNYRFDLIISTPKKPELHKTFESAIDLLNKPSNVKLIFEKDLPEYTRKTLDAINLFDERQQENEDHPF